MTVIFTGFMPSASAVTVAGPSLMALGMTETRTVSSAAPSTTTLFRESSTHGRSAERVHSIRPLSERLNRVIGYFSPDRNPNVGSVRLSA